MDFQFTAELTDFKIVYKILKAVIFKDYAIIRPMEEGLKVTLEEMRCAETSVYIPTNIFTSYYVDPNEDVKFKINIKVLTECLHIYGEDGNPSLKMSYKGQGSPLCLVMKHQDENITVDCEIYTLTVDESAELSLAYECGSNKIVVNARQFADVLLDFDDTSDDFELHLASNPPYIRMTTTSIMGESQIDISKNSEMILVFQWDSKFLAKYAFSDIKRILKVMSHANKVSISTGESGLLSLQLVINSDEKQMYVEYYVTAMFEDD